MEYIRNCPRSPTFVFKGHPDVRGYLERGLIFCIDLADQS